MTNLPKDSRAETMKYGIFAKAHGLQPETLHDHLSKLQWVLDDPRFKDPDFEIPESIQKVWGLLQMMEAEVIRVLNAGAPYHPRMALDGCMVFPHLNMYYPREWVEFMKRMGMPEPQLTLEMWGEWSDLLEDVTPMADGDIFSNYPYSINDPGWTLVLVSCITTYLEPDMKPPFATNPAQIKITDTDTLSLVLVGDVGTGSWYDGENQKSPADEVMAEIAKLDVDFTIHLGDIYYTGSTPWVEKFVEGWTPGRLGSFAMNGNHEMYAGGQGLFQQVFTDPKFAAQQGTSYFSIEFGNWLIAGMDTAYFDQTPLGFRGTISDPAQKAFLQNIRKQADEKNKKVFLITHHPPTNLSGTELNSLWDEIVAEDALGRAPEYWYWGHSHHGVVYSADSVIGEGTRCRCSGHGATPHAEPWELHEHTGPGKPIQWFAHTPYNDDIPEHRKRILNGFTTITLTKDNVVERFINQKGQLEIEI